MTVWNKLLLTSFTSSQPIQLDYEIGEKLQDTGLGDDFIDMTAKPHVIKTNETTTK